MLTVILLLACQDTAVPKPNANQKPSFVVIDIDSLRLDRMVGPKSPATQINNLALNSIFLNSVYAPASWTYPALTGLLTGQSPPLSDYDGNNVAWIPSSRRSLPEILRYYGYTTEVFWGDTLPAKQTRFSEIFGKECLDCTDNGFQNPTKWLTNASTDTPFFLFIHNMDLHHYTPSVPIEALHHTVDAVEGCRQASIPNVSHSLESRLPKQDAQTHVIAHYDGMLRYYDSQLAELFKAIKNRADADNIVIIVLANHGEALFESELLGHARIHHDSVLRTGLIWHDKSLSRKGQNKSPLSLTDVAPSILERAGIPSDHQMTGRSFLPLLRGEEWVDEPVYASTDLHVASVIEDQWKLSMQYLPCKDPSQRKAQAPLKPDSCTVLYNRLEDPIENQDFAIAMPELKNRLQDQLVQWLKLQIQRNAEVKTDSADDQLKAALKERGYWGDAETVKGETQSPSPTQPSK